MDRRVTTFRTNGTNNPNQYVQDLRSAGGIVLTVSAEKVTIDGSGAGGGVSTSDPLLTWSTAADLTNQKVVGSFLQSVLQIAMPFARGGTVLLPLNASNIIVWRAPFSCTVTAVKGYVSVATGSTINARKNGTLTHLASDLTVSSADTWMDGGAVQNTAYAAGDKLEIMLTGIAGAPSEIAVQVEFTRP
jgi:hypothetical protein